MAYKGRDKEAVANGVDKGVETIDATSTKEGSGGACELTRPTKETVRLAVQKADIVRRACNKCGATPLHTWTVRRDRGFTSIHPSSR